jgi:hypothetical protein
MALNSLVRWLVGLVLNYSKKLDNLKAACALHFAYYNWCRVHSTIRVSPAMESNLTDHIWTLRGLVSVE